MTLVDVRGVEIAPGDRCRWPGHEEFTAEQRKIYGCKTPDADACGHGDNPDEECDGCYG